MSRGSKLDRVLQQQRRRRARAPACAPQPRRRNSAPRRAGAGSAPAERMRRPCRRSLLSTACQPASASCATLICVCARAPAVKRRSAAARQIPHFDIAPARSNHCAAKNRAPGTRAMRARRRYGRFTHKIDGRQYSVVSRLRRDDAGEQRAGGSSALSRSSSCSRAPLDCPDRRRPDATSSGSPMRQRHGRVRLRDLRAVPAAHFPVAVRLDMERQDRIAGGFREPHGARPARREPDRAGRRRVNATGLPAAMSRLSCRSAFRAPRDVEPRAVP